MMRLMMVLFLLPKLLFAAPLPSNEAFMFQPTLRDGNSLILHWQMKPGYFLYQKSLSVDPNPQLELRNLEFPNPVEKTDSQGKQHKVYRNELSLPLSALAIAPGETLLSIHYQGCSDEGFCYPPQTASVKLTFDAEKLLHEVSLETDSSLPKAATINHAEQPKIDTPQAPTMTGSHVFTILGFFGLGLLLAFTPCVLPMIPILSAIIVGHGHQLSPRKAFLLSLSYVLSMAFTYGLVGAGIALLGSNLQVLMQSIWTTSTLSFIVVLMALSMFVCYELRLPLGLLNKLAGITKSQTGGHYLGAALMGSMSILILSPCVTPPLIGALGFIAETGSVSQGLLALFFLGLGMGTPLLLVGASAGKYLPKTGRWMNYIKAVFGVVLLGLAIHAMTPYTPVLVVMFAWSLLLIFSGVFLRPFVNPATTGDSMRQGFGILCLGYGLLMLCGASAGHINPLKPLESNHIVSVEHHQDSQVVRNLNQALMALSQAKQNSKPAMLDFYATWCASCQTMEKIIHEEQSQALLEHAAFIKVDLSANDAESRKLLNYFHVVAPPTFIIFDANGSEIHRIEGAVDSASFVKILNEFMTD